ncbi:MAG: hypothetical protein J3K34DRAFT_525530 [Monoraphidium minutum]|nr:MAG: hypothetical protein J3K34DRAFT_525530 [Monoraphidium minutum]
MARLACLALLALAVASASAAKPTRPDTVAWRGNARAAIGQTIAEVARDSGLSVADLMHMLNDHDIGFDKKARKMIFADEGLAVPEAADAPAGSAEAGAADPTDLALAFKLHSRPGAPRKLVLDFDGHTATGTAWNQAWGIPTIVTPAYDLDGNPADFNAQERTNIISIWRAVAEDFAAFDVDVTTEDDPNLAGSKAVIGGSSYDWYGANAGGVAYVGTFGQAAYEPAYVFQKELGNGHPKYVAEACSHELGHRLGLSHDGTATTGYFSGVGNWAPIMGNSYSKSITTWSKGDYAGANNLQDDLAIMTGSNRLTYRADDHANAPGAAATLLAGAPLATDATRSAASSSGVIETTGDADAFAFSAAAGVARVTIALTPAKRANVDLRLEVQSADGTVLATANPTGTVGATGTLADQLLSGTVDVTLPTEGTYYILLAATGDANYPVYASLGEYAVSVDYATPAAPYVLASSNWGLMKKTVSKKVNYAFSVQLVARDATGAPLANRAVSVGLTWAMTGASSVTTTQSYTTAADGTFSVVASPWSTRSSGTATLDLLTSSAVATTWNKLQSQTRLTFSW